MSEQVPSKERVIERMADVLQQFVARYHPYGSPSEGTNAIYTQACSVVHQWREVQAASSREPIPEQDTEKLAWAQRVHEDLAKYTQEDGQMIHVRAKRALGILFGEIERLEKMVYLRPAQPQRAHYEITTTSGVTVRHLYKESDEWAGELAHYARSAAEVRPCSCQRCSSQPPFVWRRHFVDDGSGTWGFETSAPATPPSADPFASKYHELLLAVERKFPGESRHATALRYIREAERQDSNGPQCSSATKESAQ